MIRMTGPLDTVPRSFPVGSLHLRTPDNNLGQKRTRRVYLPEVAVRRRELDGFDVVEGLVIKGGPQVEVLNGISLHGGLAVSWPRGSSITARFVVECLIEHRKAVGLPCYCQFDNYTIFQGMHAHPDTLGR